MGFFSVIAVFLAVSDVGLSRGLPHAYLSKARSIVDDDTPQHILATREHLNSLMSDVSILQTEDECLAAITVLNDTLQAVDDASCTQTAMEMLQSFNEEFNAAEVVEGCEAYEENCEGASLTYVSASIDVINACRNVTFEDVATGLEVAALGIGSFLIVSVHLTADILCLEINDEYCFVTIESAVSDLAANDTVLSECGDELMNTTVTCSDECADAAAEFIDEAGCCVEGFLTAAQTLEALFNDEEEPDMDDDGNVVVEPLICNQRLDFCPQLDELFKDAGIEIVTNGGNFVRPAVTLLAPMVTAAAVAMATLL